MQMSGDLYMYWHARGKNITAREYANAFLDADATRTPTIGRAGALLTAGLASWILGQNDRAIEETSESVRVAEQIGAVRELCVGLFTTSYALLNADLDAAGARANECVERSRESGFVFAEGFGTTAQGIVHALSGDLDAAEEKFAAALDVQRKIGDLEGSGLSLGGLALVSAAREDFKSALEFYRRSYESFETVGDRAEEARILDEMAWVYLKDGDPSSARTHFLDAIQAYIDLASVRGIGLSLAGVAATEAAEGRAARAVQLAAAAAVYAQQEGIVNVYINQQLGLDLLDRARSDLGPDEASKAEQRGRGLTIKDALDLARHSS